GQPCQTQIHHIPCTMKQESKMYARLPEFTPRKFTRREKTIIRQDVKRFEKIGRDHGCTTLEEYAEYVTERTHRDADGYLTQKSFGLFRALGAYFGEQLLYNTTMTRATCNVQVRKADDRLTQRSEEHTSELQSRFDLVCR